jgi:small subunit ribosomal protein S5
VPLVGSTIPHETLGRFGASRVVLRPARAGTGVIAGGSARTILELSGIRDIVAKSLGSANAINVARATVEGLRTLRTQDQEELRRGKPLKIRMIQTVETNGSEPVVKKAAVANAS